MTRTPIAGPALAALVFALGLGAAPAAAQDDVVPAVESICCGATCCFIEGECRGRGDTNPLNRCEACEPSTSQTAWTPVAGCVADAGGSPPPSSGGGGGGCAVAPADDASGVGAFLAVALGLAVARRRGRRHSAHA